MTQGQYKKQATTDELLASFDWSKTPLGEVSSWSQSLRTVVRICLGSTSPAVILWGPDMIQIYNDVFKAILGPNDKNAYGTPAQDAWQHVWSDVGPMLQRVLDNGESFLQENYPVIVSGKGFHEQRFFNISYTPIAGDTGVSGIFISMNETIGNIPAIERFRELRHSQLRDLFLKAPVGIVVLMGADYVVEIINEQMLRLWSTSVDEVLNKPLCEAVPDDFSRQTVEGIGQVFITGERVVINEVSFLQKRNGKSIELFTKLAYEPLRERNGSITGIIMFVDDITDQVNLRKEVEESEMRQRIAIDAAQIGTFDLNMQNDEFTYSDKLVSIFGYTEVSGVTRRHLTDRIHPDDLQLRIDAHQEAIRTGTLYYEARTIWPDSSIHWYKANGKVVYDKSGKPWRMLGTAIDITNEKTEAVRLEKLVHERTYRLKQQHEELKQSEERYHKMVEEIQDYAIILLDKNGVIQNWNRGAENIKLYKEEEVVGKPFYIFYLPEDIARGLPERLLDEAVKNGRAVYEGWRVRKGNIRFWGSVSITALHDDANNLIGFSKVTRDLTQRKQAEDKLQEYTLQLESRNEELEQFAYIASHDLQEPLRKIMTFSELVQANLHSPELVQKYTAKMDSSAKRMSELIKSILNYSRISREHDGMSYVQLNDVWREVVHDFELSIQEKGATVVTGQLPVIRGISHHLNQLFSNLIGNSLKFSTERPVINVASKVVPRSEVVGSPVALPDDSYIEISFSDNGIGFDQQFEKQIFEMFGRLHGRHEYTGTGIGLAICKKIMENHKGHITARSELSKGTTFYLYFPLPDQPAQ